ncbi:FAD-binding domain-containing protein [Ramaria rubella]|nr:FAD-binding domain-containing protein [Ramaria rubella]
MFRCIIVQVFAAHVLLIVATSDNFTVRPKCRTQPGDRGFPTRTELDIFNSSIDGRLMTMVPSGEFCKSLSGSQCPDTEWSSSMFRSTIPGAMLQDNWEQDYTSNPPSLCFRNSTVCGQGKVPVLGVNATTVTHIQAGVRFAQAHNLKVAIKASGHDYLGRSTAKNSFLLWTRQFQNITFHDSFDVGGEDLGSAVTVGSGVGLHTLYQAAKAQGKIFVGGTAATVVAAGGYVQGAGHSALGPTFGLAADNALEFQIVIADGSLVTTNEISNPDLFWALRGGGAGSWGIIISATFRTFPTFDAASRFDVIVVNSSTEVAQLAEAHARHIFDLDPLRAGQYFFVTATPPTFTWTFRTGFPNTSIATANATIAPFEDEVSRLGFNMDTTVGVASVNDILSSTVDDIGGFEEIQGSRLWPLDAYRDNITAIGAAYKTLFDSGVKSVLGHLVAGDEGQVSKNADINNAVNPKWRAAKTHMVVTRTWNDTTTPAEVAVIRSEMTQKHVSVLAAIAGPHGGSYSNEADVNEPDFQTTFFGPNYPRLSSIKEVYDPQELFIVGAGVGSEKWDADGLCLLD